MSGADLRFLGRGELKGWEVGGACGCRWKGGTGYERVAVGLRGV